MKPPLRDVISEQFAEALINAGHTVPAEFADEMVLLESGLDSLGFAIMITQLEELLGYDPFSLMEEAVYPQTFNEFVQIYERYSSHRQN